MTTNVKKYVKKHLPLDEQNHKDAKKMEEDSKEEGVEGTSTSTKGSLRSHNLMTK
jgi:hypothetical protein